MILKETKTQWWGNIQGVDEKIILGLTKNRFKKKKKNVWSFDQSGSG